MDINALKIEVIKLILEIEDPELLEKVRTLIIINATQSSEK